MSAPGGATETGSIVAYLSLDDTEWRRSIQRARRDLDSLRREDVEIDVRLNDDDAAAQIARLRAELAGIGGGRNDIRIRTNARSASAEIRTIGDGANYSRSRVRMLADAILILGPAAVPTAAVVGGAFAGLLPTLAATALGIAGINDMIKSGALEGTAAADDINTLKTEFTDLKAVTASGLLDGLHTALAQADPLFNTVNTDAMIMSRQIGQIGSAALPGVVSLLSQLSPLFQTFGNELIKGAEGFSRWAQSSDGVSNFVSYVQSQLPAVEHTLGSLLQLIVHLGEGLGPVGSIGVTALGAVADAINAIPVGVLRTVLPLLIATRVAMLAYRGVSAVMTGVQAAYARTAGTMQVFGASAVTANMEASLSAKTSAAEIAGSNLARSESDLAAMRSSSVASQAGIAAKAREVAAYRAAAIATSAAAEGQAKRVVAAGTVAATGWRAALGPIAGLALVLGTLAFAFGDTEDESAAATTAQQNFTESVKQSTNALDRANQRALVKSLSDSGQYKALAELTSGNKDLKVSQDDLTKSTLGSQASFDKVQQALRAYADTTKTYAAGNTGNSGAPNQMSAEGEAAVKLADDLKSTRAEFEKNAAAQKILNDQMQAARAKYAGVGSDAATMSAALGTTADRYIDAAAAARQSTDQTKAQTVAFQLANDAASLFKQTLDALNGKGLDLATAQTNLAASNLRVGDSFDQNGTKINGNTKEAVANQQAVQQSVQSAQALAEAVGKQTGSSDKAAASYRASKKALEDQLRAQGQLTPAVQAYIDKLFALGNLDVPPTKLDVDQRQAQADIRAMQNRIDAIKQGKVPGLNANSGPGKAQIAALQKVMDALKQGRVPVVDAETAEALRKLGIINGYQIADKSFTVRLTNKMSQPGLNRATGGPIGRANGGTVGRPTGGPVTGPGSATSDSIPAMMFVNGRPTVPYALSNGEYIVNSAATTRNRSALAAANNGATLAVVKMATGGEITKKKVGTTGKGKNKKDKNSYTYDGQEYASSRAAKNARNRDIKANIKIAAQIDGSGLDKFRKALKGTTDQAKAAFRSIYDDMKKVGASKGLLRNLRNMDAALNRTLAHRDKLRARLGAPSKESTTAYQRLEAVRSDRRQLVDSVTDTARGSFDVASAGRSENDRGQTTTSFGSLRATQLQSANIIEKFYNGIKTLASGVLGKSQTGKGILQDLMAKGPEAYPTVMTLLKQTSSGLSGLVSTQGRINSASARLGAFAGSQKYGAAETKALADVNSLRAQIAADDRRAKRQGDLLAKEFRRGIHGLHLDVNFDGKKAGKATRKGNKKNDRRR